jgi:hypothetical protein
MANIGIETIGDTPRSIDVTARGHRITMPEDAQAGVTITAYIEDASPGDSYRAAIIQDADKTTVLASSAIRTDITAAGWYTFSGGSLATYDPANGESFVLVVLSNSADLASVYYVAGGPGWGGDSRRSIPLPSRSRWVKTRARTRSI